ncbi:chorismate--pyruvate lyase family protein [Thiosocius teredinicola]|uniref:chorismate--pyruvate lyase family protein n=1 Tax=Thiosocius teredinicola TaxID=1973002 RepID=UPI0013DDFDF5
MFQRRKRRPTGLREAPWCELDLRRLPGSSPQMQAWLSDRGSLTRSVIASCRGKFRIDLLAQQRGEALPSEAAMLGSERTAATLIREVHLCCGRDAYVYARTLMPLSSLRGPVHALTQLGRRPLGEVLFSNPTTRRLRVEVACITPRHRLFARATDHLARKPEALWGRRTLFEYGGERILVNEIFLPGLPELRA